MITWHHHGVASRAVRRAAMHELTACLVEGSQGPRLTVAVTWPRQVVAEEAAPGQAQAALDQEHTAPHCALPAPGHACSAAASHMLCCAAFNLGVVLCVNGVVLIPWQWHVALIWQWH